MSRLERTLLLSLIPEVKKKKIALALYFLSLIVSAKKQIILFNRKLTCFKSSKISNNMLKQTVVGL